MLHVFHGWGLIVFFCTLIPVIICAQGFYTSPEEDISSTLPQMVRQNVFLEEKFHYLHVPTLGIFSVYDVFDCMFECLSNTLCFSVNLASSKGADGKLWCELLFSDKYRYSTEYRGNQSSHHFYINSPCLSSPCHNGGICKANYKYNTFECICDKGFTGEYCQKAVKSCKDLYDLYKLNVSKLATLTLNAKPISVLCHMGDFGCGDGGWTPVMKIDDNKNTFHYNSGYWTDMKEYNFSGGTTGFDTQETKLPTYWDTSFSKICLGMKIGQQLKFIAINKQANSLYSLIADGQYRNTTLGRNTWKMLIGPEASLQRHCDKEGFNSFCGSCRARIGIVSNNENHCASCDSRIGFGTSGSPEDSNTCGNGAAVHADNRNKKIKAMGYILVQ